MSVLLIQADARQIPLADKSVHCCVTSPPYWGLRDYGTAKWEGGNQECDHSRRTSRKIASSTLESNSTNNNHEREGWKGGVCGKCGAVRIDKQLGLELTPQEYIMEMVSVFREVKRVLRDDGTLWLNMGDSFGGGTAAFRGASKNGAVAGWKSEANQINRNGFAGKQLIGMPWRIAFALQDDGWYLRSDIIWNKPNSMPESVTDRPTKSHEYIFLMSKRARYWYNYEAILEPVSANTHMRLSQNLARQVGSHRANGGGKTNGPMKAVGRKPKQDEVGNRTYTGFNERWKVKHNASFDTSVCLPVTERNKRDVWTVSPQAFAEAHFATFPEELIKPCILAGCPAGGIVLDPFIGSGTTALVARNLQCNAIGIELNAEYLEIAKRRLSQEVLDFTCGAAAHP